MFRNKMRHSKAEKLLNLVARKGVIRSRDLDNIGIPRTYLARLVDSGKIQKVERGLYTDALGFSEHSTLVEVSRRVPKGVICLLSALWFHGMGTQAPKEIWIAIDVKAWHPKITSLPVKIVRCSGKALHLHAQEHRVKGGIVRVFSPAKTVADCFKFRHKIGIDVALEALRACYREKKASIDELWQAAKVCRVANVMRPYLESLF